MDTRTKRKLVRERGPTGDLTDKHTKIMEVCAEREEEKEEKKRQWNKSGGFNWVLFIPSTPEGKLKTPY